MENIASILFFSCILFVELSFADLSTYCNGKTGPVCVFGNPASQTTETPINMTIAFIADVGLAKGFGGGRLETIQVLVGKFSSSLFFFFPF